MLIENPNRKFKLIHLIELNDSNLYDFKYEDVYNVVEQWLESEKDYFFNKDFFRKFIEAFCDRFFRRDFNFDTFLDFKIALRNTFKKYRDNADRIYESSLLKLNPLYTTYMENESNTDDKGKSENTNHSENDDQNYNLFSDTPQSSLNVTDLFDIKNKYITNATNNKNTNKHDDNSNSNFENTSEFKSLQKGYNGLVADLLNNYIQLNLDVIQYYLDWIEDECLFSSILY